MNMHSSVQVRLCMVKQLKSAMQSMKLQVLHLEKFTMKKKKEAHDVTEHRLSVFWC